MSTTLTTVILTGVSGGGKTTALRALEDIDFYCVDNLPLPMLGEFIETMTKEPRVDRIAMVVDARFQQYIRGHAGTPAALTFRGKPLEIVYLDASDEVLVRRFSQTRRKHPLGGTELPAALTTERKLLEPLRAQATACIDTSELNVHQLKHLMQERYHSDQSRLVLTLLSFGYRYGIPSHADLVLDARFLPNPYFVPELKNLTGQDQQVAAFVLQQDDAQRFIDHIATMLKFLMPRYESEGKSYLTVAIGCTGGQHRSVAVTGHLGASLAEQFPVKVQHRDVNR